MILQEIVPCRNTLLGVHVVYEILYTAARTAACTGTGDCVCGGSASASLVVD